MMQTAFLLLASAVAMPQVLAADSDWPTWQAYKDNFISAEGRVVDRQGDNQTTSEGQAYGLFFALVANNRPTFERLLGRTGEVKDPHGNVRFSAAVLPYLMAYGAEALAKQQHELLAASFHPETGLYTDAPGHYEHNLIPFALGWCDRRYLFGPDGRLQPKWSTER